MQAHYTLQAAIDYSTQSTDRYVNSPSYHYSTFYSILPGLPQDIMYVVIALGAVLLAATVVLALFVVLAWIQNKRISRRATMLRQQQQVVKWGNMHLCSLVPSTEATKSWAGPGNESSMSMLAAFPISRRTVGDVVSGISSMSCTLSTTLLCILVHALCTAKLQACSMGQ